MGGVAVGGEFRIEGAAAYQAEAAPGEALASDNIPAGRVPTVRARIGCVRIAPSKPCGLSLDVFFGPILQGWDFSYISYRATPALVMVPVAM